MPTFGHRMLLLVATAAAGLSGCAHSGRLEDWRTDGGPLSPEAAKPPAQILADASRATAGVLTYHLELQTTDESDTTTSSVDVAANRRTRMLNHHSGDFTEELVVIENEVYLRAGARWWQAYLRGRAEPGDLAKVARRWIIAPGRLAQYYGQYVETISPATLARCVQAHLGTLHKGGVTDLDGQQVVIVSDEGDVPGGAPGVWFISATGKPLVVRYVQRGARTPGGTLIPECEGDGSTTSVTATFSNYDEQVTIEAPGGAIALGDAEN